jgi:hypothetical protein
MYLHVYADQDSYFLFFRNVNLGLGDQDLDFFSAEKRKIVLVYVKKLKCIKKNLEFFVVAFQSSRLRGSLELFKESSTLSLVT